MPYLHGIQHRVFAKDEEIRSKSRSIDLIQISSCLGSYRLLAAATSEQQFVSLQSILVAK